MRGPAATTKLPYGERAPVIGIVVARAVLEVEPRSPSGLAGVGVPASCFAGRRVPGPRNRSYHTIELQAPISMHPMRTIFIV